jgi:ParB/RepB/Spo0J family partition protein
MSNIVTVPINLIDENPHRNLGTYPTMKKKVEALMRSFQDVGVWEGIIARPAGDRYQLAFGHHRFEAAKNLGLSEIPLIVRDLSDEEMLKFMGRENSEDFGTEFLIMLNTWEAAVKFLECTREKTKPVDIARFLGWMDIGSSAKHPQGAMNHAAMACAAGHALLVGGYLSLDDLSGITISAAREIVQRTHSRMEQIERSAAATNTPRKQVESAKKHVAKGAKATARDVKEGRVAQKDIRSTVDTKSFESAATSKVKDTPLFAVFGKALADSIEKMLRSDASSEKLEQIAKSVNKVTMDTDRAVLRQLDYQLSELGIRAEGWRKRLIPTNEKVVGLPQLENKHG